MAHGRADRARMDTTCVSHDDTRRPFRIRTCAESFESFENDTIETASKGTARASFYTNDGSIAEDNDMAGNNTVVDEVEDEEAYSSEESEGEEVEEEEGEEEEGGEFEGMHVNVSESNLSAEGRLRRKNFADSKNSRISEISEATGYGMSSFESFDEPSKHISKIEVAVMSGDDELVSALSTNKSAFRVKKNSTNPNKNNNKKRNKSGSINRDHSINDEAADESLIEIKNRVQELQIQVNKKKRKKEKEDLLKMEKQLLRQLELDEDEDGDEEYGFDESEKITTDQLSFGVGVEDGDNVGGHEKGIAVADELLGQSPSASALSSGVGGGGGGPRILMNQSGASSVHSARSHGSGSTGQLRIQPSTQMKIESVKKYLQGRNSNDSELEEVESDVMSDSFRSRSSGGGSQSDDEAAVRRTDRREKRENAAVLLQSIAR